MLYFGRIQLKSDTEAKWIIAGERGFVPLSGELIIYSADDTHSYCRAKIGDGVTNINLLHFIDAGTISGKEVEIVKWRTYEDRTMQGSPDKLYVDMSTNTIYHYDSETGYTRLSNFTYTPSYTAVAAINNWSSGTVTTVSVENNILKINNGLLPRLSYSNTQVVRDITKG